MCVNQFPFDVRKFNHNMKQALFLRKFFLEFPRFSPVFVNFLEFYRKHFHENSRKLKKIEGIRENILSKIGPGMKHNFPLLYHLKFNVIAE